MNCSTAAPGRRTSSTARTIPLQARTAATMGEPLSSRLEPAVVDSTVVFPSIMSMGTFRKKS